MLRVQVEICRNHCLRFHFTPDMFAKCSNIFRLLHSEVLWKTSIDIVRHSTFLRFFEPHDTHITCKLPNPDRMSSFPLSDFLINFCVFMGYDGADKRSLKARKCIFSRMPGESLTQLNLFSIFNIKNMCLETTSFPCILVRIVSSSLVRTLILIIFRNINRVSLGSKFFIREKNVSRLSPCALRGIKDVKISQMLFSSFIRGGAKTLIFRFSLIVGPVPDLMKDWPMLRPTKIDN